MKIIFCHILALMAVAYADSVLRTSDGDIVDCVDKYQQPAFENLLLKSHKIQESPYEIPTMIGSDRINEWKTYEAHVSTADCPDGTVPILEYRAGSQTGDNDPTVDEHEYAEVSIHKTPKNKLYGTTATINVWDPTVEYKETEFSISQIWISSGSYKSNDLNTIEVGWQVFPGLYNDSRPRLFTYWTRDAYNITGGYNLGGFGLGESGFIQTSSRVVIGGPISPVSTFGGRQFEITILVWKDRKSGNWWLSLGNNLLVGYWPAEILTGLANHATVIDWGGEITDSRRFGRRTKTQMGSGHYAETGFGSASYFRNIKVLDDDNKFQQIDALDIQLIPDGTLFNIKGLHTDESGSQFFYGGPGFGHRHSGVVLFRFSFLLICFSFLLSFSFCSYF